MKIVYHGSFVSVPEPLTNVGRRELDFGPGFYVTTIREQAERWARRVCVIRATDTPLLSKYEFFEESLPADVRIFRLEQYNREWLDFIVSSRRGEEPWKGYDIIEGGVANDQVMRFAKPTHQMCISNQNIVDKYLHFIGTEPVAKKGEQQ